MSLMIYIKRTSKINDCIENMFLLVIASRQYRYDASLLDAYKIEYISSKK